jgi:hypothetical protein
LALWQDAAGFEAGARRGSGAAVNGRRRPLQQSLLRWFGLGERRAGVASRDDAQAVGRRVRGGFRKITATHTRLTDALYVSLAPS